VDYFDSSWLQHYKNQTFEAPLYPQLWHYYVPSIQGNLKNSVAEKYERKKNINPSSTGIRLIQECQKSKPPLSVELKEWSKHFSLTLLQDLISTHT
jgi:hypothetical protein